MWLRYSFLCDGGRAAKSSEAVSLRDKAAWKSSGMRGCSDLSFVMALTTRLSILYYVQST